MRSFLQSLLDFIPTILFFIIFNLYGIKEAIVAIIIATPISILLNYLFFGVISKMTLIASSIIALFGSSALIFDAPNLFKMKPTICSAIFGLILIYDIKKSHKLLKKITSTIELSNKQLRNISVLWVYYFAICAILNEFVWRNFDDIAWVNFKVFGLTSLNLAFIIISAIYIARSQDVKSQ